MSKGYERWHWSRARARRDVLTVTAPALAQELGLGRHRPVVNAWISIA